MNADAGAPGAPLEILITNITLATRSGTETFARDLALGLARTGHRPTVFSPEPGGVADDIRAAGVPVVADLAALETPPDLIHAHHRLPALAALARFPETPAIFVVHDRRQWTDVPPRHPSIRRYVAVDENTLDRLVGDSKIPRGATRVIHNAVDLARFLPRTPLPERPRRALVFSNYAREQDLLPVLREACVAHGIDLDVAGAGVGRQAECPEAILGSYDLVFGRGRCALEAMAVGCAVVVLDASGLAGLVTERELRAWRRLNFGARTLTRPLRAGLVSIEIGRYDAAVAARVSARIRAEADLDRQVSAFVELYRECLDPAAPPAMAGLARGDQALAAEITGLLPVWRDYCNLEGRLGMETERAAHFADEIARVRESAETRRVWLEGQIADLRTGAASSEKETLALRANCAALEAELTVAGGRVAALEADRAALVQSSIEVADEQARVRAWLEGRFRDALAERDAAHAVLQGIEASPLHRLRRVLLQMPVAGAVLRRARALARRFRTPAL